MTMSGLSSNSRRRNSNGPSITYACVECKRHKVGCHYDPGEKACSRCRKNKIDCTPRFRKQRSPAPSQSDLITKSNEKDRKIEELLTILERQKISQEIYGFLGPSPNSLSCCGDGLSPAGFNPTIPSLNGGSDDNRSNGHHGSCSFGDPEFLNHTHLSNEVVDELFQLYFTRINPFFSILDPGLHTPQTLRRQSHFLFTVICATASRHYTANANLYPLAMKFAVFEVKQAMTYGRKDVYTCQAYLLMAVYPVPQRRWAEDKSWELMGLAIQLAMELKLNEVSDVPDEKERLNRTRTWFNVFCVDASHATQFGKPSMPRDPPVDQCRTWYKTSPNQLPYDLHLCTYVELLSVMTEFRAATANNNDGSKTYEMPRIVETYDKKLSAVIEAWLQRFAETPVPKESRSICQYRQKLTEMITSYLRLVVLSSGFQPATKTKGGLTRDSYIVQKSISAAHNVVSIMMNDLFKSGFLQWSMSAHFLYVSFAAAFLLNLLRPRLSRLLTDIQKIEIIESVNRLINILCSGSVALDKRHAPALYARMLWSLLQKYHSTDNTTTTTTTTAVTASSFPADRSSNGDLSGYNNSDGHIGAVLLAPPAPLSVLPQQISQNGNGTNDTATATTTSNCMDIFIDNSTVAVNWPDISQAEEQPPYMTSSPTSSDDFSVQHRPEEPVMDFSMNNFVNSAVHFGAAGVSGFGFGIGGGDGSSGGFGGQNGVSAAAAGGGTHSLFVNNGDMANTFYGAYHGFNGLAEAPATMYRFHPPSSVVPTAGPVGSTEANMVGSNVIFGHSYMDGQGYSPL